MLHWDHFMLMAVGGGFVILGLIGILWGRHEEKSYFDSLTANSDMREFMEHWPERSQTGTLRTGGWIAIAVGFILLVVGIILWLLSGKPA